MHKRLLLLLLAGQLCVTLLKAQTPPNHLRFQQLEDALELYARSHKKIDQLIDISVTGTIQEFAIAFSKETKLNLTIEPSITQKVVTNFADTRPRDILLHLCKFYDLDLTFSGSIISLIPYKGPKPKAQPRLVDITYNGYNDKIQLNLKNDTLDQVLKLISELTKKNVISTKAASNLQVSGFIGSTNFENALEQLARRNDLDLTKDDKGYYLLDQSNTQAAQGNAPASNRAGRSGGRSRNRANKNATSTPTNKDLKITSSIDSLGQKKLSIDADNVGMAEILQAVSAESGKNYFLFAEPNEQVTLKLENVDYDTFLSSLLQGAQYTYKSEGGLYLIGEASSNGLKATKVIQLQHRSVKEISQIFPKDIGEGLEVQEFIELNSLVVSGAATAIEKLEVFIEEIDRSVPVVMIELLILNVENSRETRIGFEAGLADQPTTSGGRLFPEIDFSFSARAINRLLGVLSGNGIVNLGRVSPNFYATLQAVEDNGYVNVRSTPRLSTLNGQEATFSIGETRYFLQERTTLQGNQNPVSLQDRRFEAVNADFSIRINPIVSGDEYVTLEIEVNQSDFIGQLQTNAPPPQVNRTFNSNIRILNEEMIVLGGLESKEISESGSGVPFLARIPIIKWFFSKRRKAKQQSK
ncbi:MAG: type II secretory pathway, component PulD, partial [Bacteroidota bacterium]